MQDRRVINERYELQAMPLARGGMGEVWEARDTTLDREVAVKFVRFPDGVADDEFVRRFMRESRITARLQHPGVPAVREQRPDVPEGLDTVLRSLLAKNPEERPASARDAYEALLPFAAGAGELPGAVHPPSVPNPARMYADALSSALAAEPAADQPVPEPQQPGPIPVPESGPVQPAEPEFTRETTRRDIETARAEAGELVRDSRYSEAARLLGVLIEPARDTFGATDSDVISLRLEWANVLFESGDFRHAAPAYHDLRTDLIDRDGLDTELVFRCRMQYATCHKELGDTDTALPVMQDLLADEQRVYGPADPRTIELRRQIGMLQLGSGYREAARETLGALLNDVRAKHGEHHPAVPKIEELLAGIPR